MLIGGSFSPSGARHRVRCRRTAQWLSFCVSCSYYWTQASTLKVYAAAISAGHAREDNQIVGSHYLVSQFLKGAQRHRPSRVTVVPSWDLTLVLRSVCWPPFEPIGEAELQWLSAKTAFLLAITTAKRVDELHTPSVNQMFMRWYPDGLGVTLLPNPSFLPKRVPPSQKVNGGGNSRIVDIVRQSSFALLRHLRLMWGLRPFFVNLTNCLFAMGVVGKCVHVVGSLERGLPAGHLCCSDLGILMYLCLPLLRQCACSTCCGNGCPTNSFHALMRTK
ncbi:hypothetical protein N1851_009243 [Merluccius polli]|uniref:Uncharacterized protein n=1 Tax=Merluccius polli TaxID=89951 RepID=A0AA47N0A4_MERPO|nr:hypothetical protein N1851_009243 [Merluccius polli]